MSLLTTLILYGTLVTSPPLTGIPQWIGQNTEARRSNYLPLSLDVCRSIDDLPSPYPFYSAHFPSQVQRVISELKRYEAMTDGWSGSGSLAVDVEVIKSAIDFIRSYPAGLELPSPMISHVGEIGFYWSSEAGYIDLEIEAPSSASIYMRDRVTGMDSFEDGILMSTCDRQWYEERLSILKDKQSTIAA